MKIDRGWLGPQNRVMGLRDDKWDELCRENDWRCFCCGVETTALTVDHVIPLALGGEDIFANKQPLCGECNSRKGDRIIDYRGRLKFRGRERSKNYWYTVRHAANLLEKSPGTIRHMIRNNTIPNIKDAEGRNLVWIRDEGDALKAEVARIGTVVDRIMARLDGSV